MLPHLLLTGAAASTVSASGDGCRAGCPMALAAYYFSAQSNLTFIASLFGIADAANLLPYNPGIADPNYVIIGYRVIVPFRCSCLGLPAAASTFLAGSLPYTLSGSSSGSGGDTYNEVASEFANLTTASWLATTNNAVDGNINVTVNCSCGDKRVSRRDKVLADTPMENFCITRKNRNCTYGRPVNCTNASPFCLISGYY